MHSWYALYVVTKKTVFISKIESSEIGIIKIKNLLGKTIYKVRKNNYQHEINTSNLANGIYILQLNGMSSKVLIQ